MFVVNIMCVALGYRFYFFVGRYYVTYRRDDNYEHKKYPKIHMAIMCNSLRFVE
jgi:hypothetical protein